MSRTDTRAQPTFDLPSPEAVKFDFHDAAALTITLPKGTHWLMPLHWHANGLGCVSLKCISGPLHIYYAQGPRGSCDRFLSPSGGTKFQPGQRMGFNCSRWDSRTRASLETLNVALDADPVLWRNICSATLDRDLYPNLASTPYWLKALFALLPRFRELLLSGILWVQIQGMFYAHDLHVYHGYVPLAWPWTAQPVGGRAPLWAYRAQVCSMWVISRVVMGACFWGGWLFCGVRGEYEECTPRARDGQGDKSGSGN